MAISNTFNEILLEMSRDKLLKLTAVDNIQIVSLPISSLTKKSSSRPRVRSLACLPARQPAYLPSTRPGEVRHLNSLKWMSFSVFVCMCLLPNLNIKTTYLALSITFRFRCVFHEWLVGFELVTPEETVYQLPSFGPLADDANKYGKCW